MHALRHARILARLVLGWFVVSLGVAVAAPAMQPGLQFICTASAGFQLLPGGDGGTPQPHTLDCPLCAAVAPPPPLPHPGVAPGGACVHGVPHAVAVPRPAAVVLPPPRGPPAEQTS